MEMCLISVIVPVYNVEQFLDDCLTSIIKQSYKNIEIILVDDGSSDKSGKICDIFATQDNRIKVIHKKNGGLSSARNAGLNVATGNFIIFIDSDDYIDLKMIETLYYAATSAKVDIACCDYTSSPFFDNVISEPEILNREDAISTLFDDSGFQCFAWNKLYKKSLFKTIRYPDGKLFEDIVTTYKIFKKIDKIVYIKKPLYYYRQRNNSITKMNFNSRNKDLIDAINFVYNDSLGCGLSSERLIVGYLGYYLSYIQKAFTAKVDANNEYKVLTEKARAHIVSLIKQNNISAKKRIQLILIGIFPSVYKLLCKNLRLIRK